MKYGMVHPEKVTFLYLPGGETVEVPWNEGKASMTESDPRRRRDPSSISRARRYTPRGRTVREAADGPRTTGPGRTGRATARPRAANQPNRTATRDRRPRGAQAPRGRGPFARAPPARTGTITEPRKPEPERGAGAAKSEPVRRTGTVRPTPPRRTGPINPPRRGGRPPTRGATGPVPVRPLASLPRLGSPSRRLRMAAAFVIILLLISGTRLVQLQVTDSAAFAAEA